MGFDNYSMYTLYSWIDWINHCEEHTFYHRPFCFPGGECQYREL